MHFGDSIFIFLLALVLFGPKKLPEIGRTIGKLLAEFRRASNEFKFQIQEELRNMEDEERRKKLAEQQAQKPADALPAPDSSSLAATPTILPPSTGTQVSTSAPYAAPVEDAEATPVAATVTLSAAEVIVDPLSTTEASAPEVAREPETDSAPEALADEGLTANTNGAHASVADPVPAAIESEPVRHG